MIGAVNSATTQRKIVRKDSVNIAVGQNNIETIDIDASRIISGAEWKNCDIKIIIEYI